MSRLCSKYVSTSAAFEAPVTGHSQSRFSDSGWTCFSSSHRGGPGSTPAPGPGRTDPRQDTPKGSGASRVTPGPRDRRQPCQPAPGQPPQHLQALQKAEVDAGTVVKPSARTVDQFFTEWPKAVRLSLKKSTYANYRTNYEAYVKPIIGHWEPSGRICADAQHVLRAPTGVWAGQGRQQRQDVRVLEDKHQPARRSRPNANADQHGVRHVDSRREGRRHAVPARPGAS